MRSSVERPEMAAAESAATSVAVKAAIWVADRALVGGEARDAARRQGGDVRGAHGRDLGRGQAGSVGGGQAAASVAVRSEGCGSG